MATPRTPSSTNVYKTIWRHIDKNLTEWVSERGNNTIEKIRWELFDILTLWKDEKSRTEIWNNIKSELEQKLSNKEEEIKEKRRRWEVPSKREEREIIILKRFIKDVEYRLGHWISTPDVNDINGNVYMDLDKNDSFDKDVIKDVADDILNSDIDDLENNPIILRLLQSNKYYGELCSELSKRWRERKDVKRFFNRIKQIRRDLISDEKIRNLDEKLIHDQVLEGKTIHRLKDKNDIKQRFNNLKPGDRIKLNDGSTIIVINKSKYWNKITVKEDRGNYWTQEITENFNDFSNYRCPLENITEIIIWLKLPN